MKAVCVKSGKLHIVTAKNEANGGMVYTKNVVRIPELDQNNKAQALEKKHKPSVIFAYDEIQESFATGNDEMKELDQVGKNII